MKSFVTGGVRPLVCEKTNLENLTEQKMPNKSTIKSKTTAAKVSVATRIPVAAQAEKVQPVKITPSREQIARRAYEIYVARGKAAGHEMADWIQAERELSGHASRNWFASM
jgi:hypothetical protein